MTIAETIRTASSPPVDLLVQAESVAGMALGHFASGDIRAARDEWKRMGLLLRSSFTEPEPGAPRLVTLDGRTLNGRGWARKLGVSTSGMSYRLKMMPAEVALIPPEVRARVDRVWEICRFGRLLRNRPARRALG